MFPSQVGKGRTENLQNVFHYFFILLVFLLKYTNLFFVPLPFSGCLNPVLHFSVCSAVCSFLLPCALCCSFPPSSFSSCDIPHAASSSLFSFVLSPQCLSPICLSHFCVIIVLIFLSQLLLCILCWCFQKQKYFFMLNRGVPSSSIHEKLFQV